MTGLALIISAPSGAGKTTLCKSFLEQDRTLHLSISCTTRPPRAGEREGVDYHFLSETEFLKRKDQGRLLEWAQVHGHYYGTPREGVETPLKEGRDVLLNIDVQGGASLRRALPRNAVLIFVCPPSLAELEKRLRQRGQDDENTIQLRLKNAQRELAGLPTYDYLVINDTLSRALADIEAIRTAEHHRLSRLEAQVASWTRQG